MRGFRGTSLALAAAALLAGAGACGGSSNTSTGGSSAGGAAANGGTTSMVCVPGQSSACAGPKGCSGYQVCKSDGSGYAPCSCGSGGTGAGGNGGTDAGADGASGAGGNGGTDASAGGTSGAAGNGGTDASAGGASGAAGNGGTDAGAGGGAGGSGGTSGSSAFPTTCAEAASLHGPYGCEFWPTVTGNVVWSTFDFAVLVDNPGKSPANVTVTRGGTSVTSATVGAGQVATLYLPWVPELKGADADSCGALGASQSTVLANQGAYRLTSTAPVGAYQFNAYEYQGTGGPSGKDWSSCPGNQTCASTSTALGCYAFSNDGSMLLPTTSLGTSYRATGHQGWQAANIGPYMVITATQNSTLVTVQASGDIVAGSGIPATSPGGSVQLSLDAGDVVSLAGSTSSDLSGSLITSDKPVQVITGMSCVQNPFGTAACDHIEETVLPATALGRDYIVTAPTGPGGTPVGHVVRLFGHVDGTMLAYPAGTQPAGAPTTLSAGQVAELGPVSQSFEVQGSQPFGVTSILVGGSILDPSAPVGSREGDPSQTDVIPVEQYRSAYSIAVADNYDSTYLDVTAPIGATLTLDGAPLTVSTTPVGSSNFAVARIPLTSTPGQAHTLLGDAPFSVQVTGYGLNTSYQYPGGYDVNALP